MIRTILDFLVASGELVGEGAAAYWRKFKTFSVQLGIGLAAVGAVTVALQAAGVGQAVPAGIFVGSLIVAIWLSVAFPILIGIRLAARVKSVDETLKMIATVVLLPATLAVFIYATRLWLAPAWLTIVLLLFGLNMLYRLFGSSGLEAYANTSKIALVTIAVLGAVIAFLPPRVKVLGGTALDRVLGAAPRQIEYAANMAFYSATGGKPLVWYYKSGPCEYALYDGAGYHPATGAPLVPIDSSAVAELRRCDEARRIEVERQREEERKQEETRREAERKQAEERQRDEERRLAAQKADDERIAEEHRKAEELRLEKERFPFGRELSLPARVAISSAVATDKSRVGDMIGALPIEPIAFSSDTRVSAPSEFALRVAALAPRSGDREAAIVLEPVRLTLEDGRVFAIEGESIVVAKDESARGDWLRRLGKVAIGAGIGATAGAVLGGDGNRAKGAAIGGAAGAGAMGVALITRRNHIEAPRGYPLVFTVQSVTLSETSPRVPAVQRTTSLSQPCYVGIWQENNPNELRWRIAVVGERLQVQRTDGFVGGMFTPMASGWRGQLRWGNGDISNDVVLYAPDSSCREIRTNQRWWFRR